MPTSTIDAVMPRRGRGPARVRFTDGTEAGTFDDALLTTATSNKGAVAEYETETKESKGKQYVNLIRLTIIEPAVVESELVTPDPPAKVTALAPVDSQAIVVRHELAPSDVVALVAKIQDVMRLAMKKGEDYGLIPGVKKPSLFKAGAEKLCFLFRLCPEYEELSTSIVRDTFLSYAIRCSLVHIPTGVKIATGIGSCNSRERKYQHSGSNPWDLDNTLRKMACKRALVAAVLNGTAASAIFTQDVEDMTPDEPQLEPKPKPIPEDDALEAFTADAVAGFEGMPSLEKAKEFHAWLIQQPSWPKLGAHRQEAIIRAKNEVKARFVGAA